MNARDAERMKTSRDGTPWRCVSCGNAPTCPMLNTETWDATFAAAPKAPATCMCHEGVRGRHHTRCGLGDRPHKLLCLDCAEKALGREITVEDLSPCIANYATYVLVSRVFDAARRGELLRPKTALTKIANASAPRYRSFADDYPDVDPWVGFHDQDLPF